MKRGGIVLVVASLVVGALAAARSYVVPIQSISELKESGNPLTLNAPAGLVVYNGELPLAVAQERGPLLAAQSALSPLGGFAPLNLTFEAASLAQGGFAYDALARVPAKQLAEAKYDGALGVVQLPDGSRVALFRKGEKLSGPVIAALERNYYLGRQGPVVRNVTVREFSLARWAGNWVFLAACLGLLGGAALLRLASKREIAVAGAAGDAEGPDRALAAIRQAIDGLRREVAGGPSSDTDLRALHERLREEDRAHLDAFMESRKHLTRRLGPGRVAELQKAANTPAAEGLVEAIRADMGGAEVTHLDTFLQAHAALAERLGLEHLADLPNLLLLPRAEQARLALILERIGNLQKTHMAAFVEARPLLVARLGLGGYAELMDRYAAAERQINRAWSAAADGVPEEAVRCLDQASELLAEAAARLGGKSQM